MDLTENSKIFNNGFKKELKDAWIFFLERFSKVFEGPLKSGF